MTVGTGSPDYRSVVAQGFIELLSPLSHGGDTDGTIRSMRREKFKQADGRYERVPVYSGNAFRGQLRDCGMLYMLRQLGMGDATLSLASFYFLFSGGTLTKEAGQGIDIDRARELRSIIPLVGVFGGAVGRQTMHSKLRMGRGVPVVQETVSFLPEPVRSQATESVYDALQVLEFTRTDDAKNERLSHLLPTEQRALLEGPRVKIAADGAEVATGSAQQMRYGEETLATGTLLWHEWFLEDVSDLELQAFVSALYVFAQQPFIGGNSRIGHGKVALRYNGLLNIEPLQVVNHAPDTALALEPGAAYNAHLAAHADEIRDLLGTIR